MSVQGEKLGSHACVKGTMLQAHLAWAAGHLAPDWRQRLAARVDGEAVARVADEVVLATEWIPLRTLVAIDRAIAAEHGSAAEQVFRELGRNSAIVNLGGVYKAFVQEEPHRFFEQMAVLHGRFLNFGRCVYARLGPRAGAIRMEGYEEYSPVFCASASGYYEGALAMMHVPGPIRASETSCHCRGDGVCVFELAW